MLPRKKHTRTKEYNRGSLAKIAIELFMLNSILEAVSIAAAILPSIIMGYLYTTNRREGLASVVRNDSSHIV